MRRVRLAFVTSVMCFFPPVSFHISQESIVPNKASPLSEDEDNGKAQRENKYFFACLWVSTHTKLLKICRLPSHT